MPPKTKLLFHMDLRTLGYCTRSRRECLLCYMPFCDIFGKEEAAGRKRNQATNTKFFSSFKRAYYQQHHENQHAEEWKAYQLLSSVTESCSLRSRSFCEYYVSTRRFRNLHALSYSKADHRHHSRRYF